MSDEPARILIVEDEAIVALDLQHQLQELGYRVAGVAGTGEQALALARTEHPELTLMDVRLRGAMDGVQVAQALAQEMQAPVVYLTSYSDDATVHRAAETAPYGYLTKPFQARELHAAIEVALYKSRMERRLRESERWFASTLRCVQDGVLITESDARVRFLNSAAEALTGWTLEQARGRPVAELLRFRDEGGDCASSAERALSAGRVVGVTHGRALVSRDGHDVHVDESAAPVSDDQGRLMGAVVVLRDATQRMAQEERLRASEQRFRSAFDHAPLGMALVSLDGRFMQVNEALCRLLGGDSARFSGCPQAQVTHPDDVAHEQQWLQRLLIDGSGVAQFEKRYLRQGGADPVYTLVSVSLLREGEHPVCYLYQVHDLTAQRQAAEQLAELAAGRMQLQAAQIAERAKTEFLARMSHELRTPLNAVLGFAQLMKIKGATDSASAAAYTDHILQAGQHLVALVDDVLDLQRVATGRLQLELGDVALDVNVGQVLHFLQPMAAQYDVQFLQQIPAGLLVRADEVRLRQVLLNVGSNAVKYNRPGGTVTWRVAPASPGRVRLWVDDTGVGITPAALSHLFQPFERLGQERSRIPGTGLGLLIARNLMRQMGGELTVTSEPGIGTSVCVELAAGTGARE